MQTNTIKTTHRATWDHGNFSAKLGEAWRFFCCFIYCFFCEIRTFGDGGTFFWNFLSESSQAKKKFFLLWMPQRRKLSPRGYTTYNTRRKWREIDEKAKRIWAMIWRKDERWKGLERLELRAKIIRWLHLSRRLKRSWTVCRFSHRVLTRKAKNFVGEF